jgi:hypothetical protein
MKGTAIRNSRRTAASMSRVSAEALAVEGLTFLAAERIRIERFLALAGLAPDTLRAAAASPGFLAAVLDHLASEEDLLLAFATNRGIDPDAIVAASRILSPDREIP